MQRWRTCAMATATVGLLITTSATAQQYPAQNITFVVGFAAGGIADGIGRLIAQRLGQRLNQNVVVENRGGAGGNLAAKAVAGANADGYTILVTTTALAINETMYKNKGFGAADFKPIAIVASSPESLSTHPSNPGSNLAEFVNGMKGRTINFGSAGVGSGSHIAAEYFFKVLAKTPATHVPFQGGAPAINAAVANHIDMIAGTTAGAVAGQINGGNLKGLGVASEKRISVVQQVPTVAEAGYGSFVAASWVGFFAPSKVSAEVAAKLNAEIDAIVKEPEVNARLKQLGFDPINGSQAEADTFFKSEVANWGKMVGTLGLSIE